MVFIVWTLFKNGLIPTLDEYWFRNADEFNQPSAEDASSFVNDLYILYFQHPITFDEVVLFILDRYLNQGQPEG